MSKCVLPVAFIVTINRQSIYTWCTCTANFQGPRKFHFINTSICLNKFRQADSFYCFHIFLQPSNCAPLLFVSSRTRFTFVSHSLSSHLASSSLLGVPGTGPILFDGLVSGAPSGSFRGISVRKA